MSFETPTWLSVKLIEKLLKNSESNESIAVSKLTTCPAVKKGDNYGSEMLRVSFEYSSEKVGHKSVENKSLIFKIGPTEKGATKEMLDALQVFETEIMMMETTLERMNDILDEKDHSLSPRVLYSEIGSPSFLVLEDLTPLGYRMANKLIGLDLDHCLITMRRLARLHASSVAICEKDPELKMFYNKGTYQENHPEHLKEFYRGGLRTLAYVIREWSEMGPSRHIYSEKLLNLSEKCYERGIECVRQKNDFNVINHGDLWVNNLLFRYDDNKKIIDHIFVDFQLAFWNSPAIDILHFFNTSTSEDVNINHLDLLLHEYHKNLETTMSCLGLGAKIPTMECLAQILRNYEFYGLMISCTMTPLTLFDGSNVDGPSTILHEGADINPAYLGETFRKIIIRRLPIWNSRGLLDV